MPSWCKHLNIQACNPLHEGKLNGFSHDWVRVPSEMNRPAVVAGGLPLVREFNHYMTAQWVDLVEDCWDQVAPVLMKGVVGWLGVHDYRVRKKTGNIVISVPQQAKPCCTPNPSSPCL